MNSTRLCYDELVYLSVSLTHAKEIYGLTPKSVEVPVNWDEVRKGLIEKGLLTENGESLQIHPQLAYMISAIGNPKMFISISASAKGQTGNFYLTRHFAVKMVRDKSEGKDAEDQYLLSSYSAPEDVYQALDDIIQWEPFTQNPRVDRAAFTLDGYEAYLKTIRRKSREEHDAILAGHGFSEECARDVFETLSKKKYWFTMVMLSFDPQSTGGKHVAEQTVVYKGDKYLWDMEISNVGALLFTTSREMMQRKLEIIASLFKYF